jgi:hypothetical protein
MFKWIQFILFYLCFGIPFTSKQQWDETPWKSSSHRRDKFDKKL